MKNSDELPLPDELQSLVAAERAAPGGSAEDHARIRARLGVGVGALPGAGSAGAGGGGSAAGGTATSAAGPAGAASATGSSAALGACGATLATKALILSAALAAASGGGYLLGRRHSVAPEQAAAAIAEPFASRRSTDAPLADAAPPPLAAPAPPDPAVATADRVRSEANDRWTDEPYDPRDERGEHPQRQRARAAKAHLRSARSQSEAKLIIAAWKAVERRDRQAAEAAVAAHRRQFPAGALAEERSALHVMVLGLGPDREAIRHAARAFLARYPDSVHTAEIERLLRDLPGDEKEAPAEPADMEGGRK